jgi:hypothetical protein
MWLITWLFDSSNVDDETSGLKRPMADTSSKDDPVTLISLLVEDQHFSKIFGMLPSIEGKDLYRHLCSETSNELTRERIESTCFPALSLADFPNYARHNRWRLLRRYSIRSSFRSQLLPQSYTGAWFQKLRGRLFHLRRHKDPCDQGHRSIGLLCNAIWRIYLQLFGDLIIASMRML